MSDDTITDDELDAMEAWNVAARWPQRMDVVNSADVWVVTPDGDFGVQSDVVQVRCAPDRATKLARAKCIAANDAPRLIAALQRARIADDPMMDATDGAHPAWWRGHDHVAAKFREQLDASRAECAALKARLADAGHTANAAPAGTYRCGLCGNDYAYDGHTFDHTCGRVTTLAELEARVALAK